MSLHNLQSLISIKFFVNDYQEFMRSNSVRWGNCCNVPQEKYNTKRPFLPQILR